MHFSFVQKLGASLLITAWLLWGSDMIGNALIPVPEAPAESAAKAEKTAKPKKAASQQASAAKKPAPAAKAKDLATLLAEATPAEGEKVFRKCKGCHNAKEGAGAKVGPDLWNVVGRPKASAPGFNYSSALKKKGGDWTYADLDAFLTSPKTFVPGTRMPFAGLKKPEDRAAVIAYLRSLSDSPKPLP